MARIYCNLAPTLKEKVDNMAYERGMSRSETINLFLGLGIRFHEEVNRNYMSDEMRTYDEIINKKA
jgi:metal-responsive CopG/Arc/MetJ family transcriptional regulator